MDPITITIVTALAAGAAAGANGVASSAITDAYAGLKRLIADRYQKAAPFAEAVEADPVSKPEQTVLAKQLDQVGAGKDDELKAAAQALLDAVDALRDKAEATALFDFDQLHLARDAQFENIEAAQVLRVRDKAQIGRDLRAKNIRQTGRGTAPTHRG